MKHENVIQTLGEVLKKLKPESDLSMVTDETRLVEDLGMDSLTLLMMALQSEKKFGIRFENMQASSFRTVGDVCRYIEGKL
jgi:acyl carrier protein